MKQKSQLLKKSYVYCGLACFVLLYLNSCCKAGFSYTVYYNNSTKNKIELKYYKNSEEGSLILSSMSTIQAPFLILPDDSVLIFINDQLKEIHYPENTLNSVSSAKSIRFSEPGNLYNRNNYALEKMDLKCNGSITKSTYIFK